MPYVHYSKSFQALSSERDLSAFSLVVSRVQTLVSDAAISLHPQRDANSSHFETRLPSKMENAR